MQEYLAVMPGDAYPLWIHRASQNHVPCVIIISGRVVGKAAFYRFLVIVSTIIYRAYPPEKRLLEWFSIFVSFTIATSVLCPLWAARIEILFFWERHVALIPLDKTKLCACGQRLVSKSYPFMSVTSRSYRSTKWKYGHGVSGLIRNSLLLWATRRAYTTR